MEACRAFIEGKVLQALATVYYRGQKKLSKRKEFIEALDIFQNITGQAPIDYD